MIERPAMAGILLASALAFVVMLGGTAFGETSSAIRLINALIAGALIVTFALRSPGRSDRLDRAMVAALALFALSGALSAFPRQSFDAVLAALTWVAGLWVAREQLADRRARRLVLATFIALSAIFTLLATGRWLVPTMEWWRAVEWQVVPPLNFELGAFPWGHRHDLTLLIVMLYPAWWIGSPSLARRAAALSVGGLSVGIVLVDGSRALWLAMLVASAVVALPSAVRFWRRLNIGWPWVLGAAVAVAVVLVVSGLGTAFIERATSAATLEYRAAMWSAVARDWVTHPAQGNGPGSFPWILQLTGYFDKNSWAPRHPDSAVVQGLAEGGLLVLAAMAIVVIAVGWRLLSSPSRAGQWALVTFAVASINASPTDFAFLIAVTLTWVAYSAPRAPVADRQRPAWRATRFATVGCLVIVGIAYGSTLVASFEQDRAGRAVSAGNLPEAQAALDNAVALDPGMALYVRQRATAAYLRDDLQAASRDLETATSLNPADDLAWRTFALVRVGMLDEPGGEEALGRAIELQRSDTTNLLTMVRYFPENADDLLAEVVQAWPTFVFALAWDESLPPTLTTRDVVDAALTRWDSSASMPELEHEQGLWLATLADRSDLADSAVERSGWNDDMASTLTLAIRCESTEAALDAMPPAAQADHWYWWLRAREDILAGGTGEEAMRMAHLMGRDRTPAESMITLNPLNENARVFNADLWGYRRRPIIWPGVEPPLPSHEAGEARWLFDPGASAGEAELDPVLDRCHGE